ncbi:glycerophosphoryl diester phosphodiesterase [Gemmatimonadetes bacterium T265]|nr:glycerophosphoryl diester phosphodiesterase [Gemmatimonadetes bacterium T265]
MILLDPDARLVIAHRGDSAHAPENTIESFTRAVAAGVHALEFDCRASSDGVAVVIHDAALDRTTDARGPVRARSAAALGEIDAGAAFSADGGRTRPYAGRGIGIPTLGAVLDGFPEVPVLIEVKEYAACDAVRATLDRHAALGRAVVASFLDNVMGYFRATPYPTAAAQTDVARLLRAAVIGGRVEPSYRAASVPPTYRGLPLPLGRFARLLRPSGVPVHVWTVDDPRTATRLWNVGVSGMVSNDPARVLGALSSAGVRGNV